MKLTIIVFPPYLGVSIIFSFFFFIVEVILDWMELIMPPKSGFPITGTFFIIGIGFFLLSGIFVITEILKMLLKEFRATNDKQKEAEQIVREIGENSGK